MFYSTLIIEHRKQSQYSSMEFGTLEYWKLVFPKELYILNIPKFSLYNAIAFCWLKTKVYS